MQDVEVTLFETLQIKVPGILKGHGGYRKGMGTGAVQETLQVVTRFGAGAVIPRGWPPLPSRYPDGGQCPFPGGFGRAVAGSISKTEKVSIFLHQVFG